jgi:hypothetical protein
VRPFWVKYCNSLSTDSNSFLYLFKNKIIFDVATLKIKEPKIINKIFQNVHVYYKVKKTSNLYCSSQIKTHSQEGVDPENGTVLDASSDPKPVKKNLFAFVQKLCLVSGVPCGRQLDKMGHITGREDFVNGAARLPQLHNVLFCPAE